MSALARGVPTLVFLVLSSACTTSPSAVVVTYNVGLARGFVDYADQRAEPVAAAVAALDADVVCLQEVWLREEVGTGWETR